MVDEAAGQAQSGAEVGTLDGTKFCAEGTAGGPCPDREACMSGWTCREVKAAADYESDPQPEKLSTEEKALRVGHASWLAMLPMIQGLPKLTEQEAVTVGHAAWREVGRILDEDLEHSRASEAWNARHPSLQKAPAWEVRIKPHRVASHESKYRVSVHRNGSEVGLTFCDTKWGARREAKKMRRRWEAKQLTTPTVEAL